MFKGNWTCNCCFKLLQHKRKTSNTMSLPLLVLQLSDNVQEFCYIITDIFRINEIWKFCGFQVRSLRTQLFEKFGSLMDRSLLDGKHLENAINKQVLFNQIEISSPSQSLDKQRMQALLMTKIASHTKKNKKKHKLKTSTPLNYNKDSKDVKKLSEELIDLKYRLFNLEQEMKNVKEQMTTLCQTRNDCCHKSYYLPSIQGVMEPHLFPSSFPPPPPPPPPPPILKKTTSVKRKNCVPLKDHNVKLPAQKLDMAALLKGLKDVKLKPTDRSPGGTPVRKTKPTSGSHMDILQEVLKKRFQCIHPVEIHKENISDSWEISPNHSLSNEL